MPYEFDFLNLACDRRGGCYGFAFGVLYREDLCRSLFAVGYDADRWLVEILWVRVL